MPSPADCAASLCEAAWFVAMVAAEEVDSACGSGGAVGSRVGASEAEGPMLSLVGEGYSHLPAARLASDRQIANNVSPQCKQFALE